MKDVRDYLVKMVTDQKSQSEMARHLLAIKGRTRVDNYLMNRTTGAVARQTRQAGFNRPATAKKPSSGVRPAGGTVPRTAPATRR